MRVNWVFEKSVIRILLKALLPEFSLLPDFYHLQFVNDGFVPMP